MTNKKKICAFSYVALCFATVMGAALSFNAKMTPNVAKDKSFTLTLDKNNKITAEEKTAKQFTRKTALNNDVYFECDNFASENNDYFTVLNSGGYVANTPNEVNNMIASITSIKIVTNTNDGRYRLSYGTEYGTYPSEEIYRAGNYKSGWEDTTIKYNLSYPANYFKFEALSGGLYIRSIEITYTCNKLEGEQLNLAKECFSNDIFYGAQMSGTTNNVTSEGLIVDLKNTEDLMNAESGYAIKYTAPAGYNHYADNDAPYIVLGQSYDLSNNNLVLFVKESSNVFPDIQVQIIDSKWDLICDYFQVRLGNAWASAGLLTHYRAINIPSSLLKTKLVAGKSASDLEDISILRLSFDFKDGTSSEEQSVYIDRGYIGRGYYGYSNSCGNANSYCWTDIALDFDPNFADSDISFKIKPFKDKDGGNYVTRIEFLNGGTSVKTASNIIEGTGLRNTGGPTDTIHMKKVDNGFWDVLYEKEAFSSSPTTLRFAKDNQSMGLIVNLRAANLD